MEPGPTALPPFPGHIYTRRASVFAPIVHRIRRDFPDAANSLRSSNRSLRSKGKPRPCLIIDIDDEFYTVCLIASFEGEPIETLPEILRYFLVSVSSRRNITNSLSSTTVPTTLLPRNQDVRSFTLTTNPQWQYDDDVWIIACPFAVHASSVRSLWQLQDGSTPAVEPAMLTAFQEVYQRLEVDLNLMIRDENIKNTLFDELSVRLVLFAF